MKFDFFGIVMMIIAVAIGQLLGGYVETMLGGLLTGFLGSLVAALVVGFIIYAIYTLVSGGKINLTQGLIFAVIVYVANMMAGYIAGYTGLGGGVITLVVVGVLASLLWGWVGGKKANAPIST